ncbi:MAG: TraR/DksA C4-type zinc finger protein [Nitrospirota bacterium]
MAKKKTKKKPAGKQAHKEKKPAAKKPLSKPKATSVRSKELTAKPAKKKEVKGKSIQKKDTKVKGKPIRKTVAAKPKAATKLKKEPAVAAEVRRKVAGSGARQKAIEEEERRVSLRRFLVRRREEILKEAKKEISKYIKGETRQLVDTALDDGDWSVVDLSEDVSLRQLSTHHENLQRIDEALRKLDEGTYGICEDCGEEISEERLRILPFAIYCTDCQEKREQLAELERREG